MEKVEPKLEIFVKWEKIPDFSYKKSLFLHPFTRAIVSIGDSKFFDTEEVVPAEKTKRRRRKRKSKQKN